jgi:hypothetical protein
LINDLNSLMPEHQSAIVASAMLGNAFTESAGTFDPGQWQLQEVPPCSWATDNGQCWIGLFQYTYGGPTIYGSRS